MKRKKEKVRFHTEVIGGKVYTCFSSMFYYNEKSRGLGKAISSVYNLSKLIKDVVNDPLVENFIIDAMVDTKTYHNENVERFIIKEDCVVLHEIHYIVDSASTTNGVRIENIDPSTEKLERMQKLFSLGI